MKTCRAMRNASLGGRRSWACGETARWATRGVPRRDFSVLPLLKGLHDGIGKSVEVAQWLRKGPLAPGTASSRLQRPAPRHPRQTTVQQFQTSAPLNSWRISAPTPPTPDASRGSALPLPEQVRGIMRLLPHSVVVCTSNGVSTTRSEPASCAMTMSSFTSLTLTPTPLVSFNVKTPSRTLEAIAESKAFNIHILAQTPAGASLADHFTKGNMGEDVFAGLEEGVECERGAGRSPLIKGEAVMYVLSCRLVEEAPMNGLMPVRDHVIVAGEVLDVIPGSGESEFGLAYGDRKYRQLGRVLSNDG